MLFLTVNLLVAKFPLYHVPPTRACIFDVFADQNGRIPSVGSVVVANIWKPEFPPTEIQLTAAGNTCVRCVSVSAESRKRIPYTHVSVMFTILRKL